MYEYDACTYNKIYYIIKFMFNCIPLDISIDVVNIDTTEIICNSNMSLNFNNQLLYVILKACTKL